MRDSFADFHPTVNFLYFALVLFFSMCLTHPISLVISLIGALCYGGYQNADGIRRLSLRFVLPIVLLTAVVNPLFNHEGATILHYLPSGNPLTLESIAFGISSAILMANVMLWFSCYSAVMTSDKFVYLFGRIIPALSLVLSMSLRFVPKFGAHLAVVEEGQRSIGRDGRRGNPLHRIKMAVTTLSIMITWSLENAIETADSMKSRGYGLAGRTAFSIYTLDERDRIALLWLTLCGCYIGSGWVVGGLDFRYYPLISGAPLSPLSISFQAVYLALCLTPIVINKKEDFVWNCQLNKQ